MALSDTPTLLTPPELGVARVRIPGLSRLSTDEQLRAATLALNRDLGVNAAKLRLAVRSVTFSSEDAWIAYTSEQAAANGARSTQIFSALNAGKTYWVGAPGGYIVGAQGAAAVEAVDAVAAAEGIGLPAIVAAMLSPSAGAASPANDCVLVDRDRERLSDHTLALWQAASGVAMIDGSLPTGNDVPLVAAPSLQTVARTTGFDVALRYAAVASVACALIAGARLVMMPASSAAGVAVAAQKQPSAGALLERVATIAPEALARTQSATYASGAWVFSLNDAFDGPAQSAMQRALESNGLQAQATGAPTPRLRVSLAP